VLIALSLAGSLLGTYLTEPENMEILKHFYKTTRPWGCWRPVRDAVLLEDPSFVPNQNALRDCTNVAVGIVWQLCLTSLPIYLVLRSWKSAAAVLVLLIATSTFIKLNWYDKLPAAGSAEAA
jgi:SSS family solute:Na+ symporter